jgi:signal transduction histidine kinase
VKLWQKIFLLTLALVIIVVNTTSLALLSSNHRLTIEREQQNALARHNYLVAEFQNTIIYTQLIERTVSLSDEEALGVAKDVLERQRGDGELAVSLFDGDTVVHSVNQQPFEEEVALLAQPDYTSVIVEGEGKVYLLIVSTTSLNERNYRLVSSFDISSTYDLFRTGFDQVRVIGVISALAVAGLLLLLVRGLLMPLRSLSGTTRRIASGDFDKRAIVRGHDELAEVARNFNTMADSIEHNVTELEHLAESRRIFIGNLAHEMKTPLTSILGFADILRVKREVSDNDRIEYASVIVSETKRLKGLSGKLMELLSVGNMQITAVPIEVHELAEELTATLQPILKNHKMEFACVLPKKSVWISADDELIKSFVFNLIDNSIKASSSHSTITLRVAFSKEEEGRIELAVHDEGVGIPEDQIPLLTEPFYMLDKARTRKHGGAGLGLALCAEIARAHGSQLQIKSKPLVGTTVSVTLAKANDHD